MLAALALPDADDRAAALAQLGIGAVVRDRTVPTTRASDAAVGGTAVFDGGGLEVVVLDAPVHERQVPAGWLVALGLAWAAFLGLAGFGVWNGGRAISSRMRTRPGPG